MGKDKKKGTKQGKANIFKVAGAKSLKKTKSKAVNLGLKNMKQKVAEIDKQLLDIKKCPSQSTAKPKVQGLQKKEKKNVTKEEIASTADKIVDMDL